MENMNKQLSNPPVKEAVIELHYHPYIEIKSDSVDIVKSNFTDDYELIPLQGYRFNLNLSNSEESAERNKFLNSLIIRNKEKGTAIHIKRESVAVIKSTPYVSFEELLGVFREVWSMVVQTYKPENVTKTALRYINTIKLEHDVENYIKDAAMFNLSTFVDKKSSYHRFDVEKNNCKGVIQFIYESNKEDNTIDFDLTVSSDRRHLPNEYENVEREFHNLRGIKNDMFFDLLTDQYIRTLE